MKVALMVSQELMPKTQNSRYTAILGGRSSAVGVRISTWPWLLGVSLPQKHAMSAQIMTRSDGHESDVDGCHGAETYVARGLV